MDTKKDLSIQMLRGLAICAVVLIHCLPQNTITIILRPFLNFAVALFLFLSGMLTPQSKIDNLGLFYKRRIGKILIPYLVWSLVYLCKNLTHITPPHYSLSRPSGRPFLYSEGKEIRLCRPCGAAGRPPRTALPPCLSRRPGGCCRRGRVAADGD